MLVKRETRTGSNNLNTVYRPCSVSELFGNERSKKTLKNALDNNKLSHTLLFSGPSGCGKTTAARITALGLNCQSVDKPTSDPCLQCQSCRSIMEGYSMDVMEINVGKDNGKADVANVVETLAYAPTSSRFKVIIFDEAHELTNAAKELLLKPTEDGYAHVYFIFCTNQPEALESKESKKKGGNPFLGRCVKLNFNVLDEAEISTMLKNILQFEGEDYKEDVLDLIVSEARGVPRDALILLDNIINEGSWSIDAAKSFLGVALDEEDSNIIELCKAINKGTWKESCRLYDIISKNQQAESIRIAMGFYYVACLKKANMLKEARRFSEMLDLLSVPIYTSGKPANILFYNMLFKLVDVVTKYKGGK